MFKKILIANRGEIACRVIKTARELGILSVAVYSEADSNARHVRMADEAIYIGEAPSTHSYLCGDKIIQAALDTGAQAIHPGYGFLSENAKFAADCAKAGLVFIGPSAESIIAMGLKDRAKAIMDEAGVPVVPGYQGDNQDPDFLAGQAQEIGYPVLIKAVAGGGGKGMRLVKNAEDFAEALGTCQREAKAAFGNNHVLIEKYIVKPRHIEVQVFGDTHGNVVHLFERDCSLQRRHQKVVEEAPAPNISDTFRNEICAAAVRAAAAIHYHGAGTVEFIASGEDFYFMEMNTRLQVEHPVTEMITGQDLVAWQLKVAAGEKLPLAQEALSINGHAFEARIYAEDPVNDFLPQTGKITHFRMSAHDNNLRVDTGVEAGDEVSIYYDPMIAKLIAWGADRDAAAAAMVRLLGDVHITGVSHNQEFISSIFAHNNFLVGDIDTGFIPSHEDALLPQTYGRAGKEELAFAALYYLLGLERSFLQSQNPWDRHDNWRMGTQAVERNLKLVNRGEIIEVSALCKGTAIEIDGIKSSLISYQDDQLVAYIDGQKRSVHVLKHSLGITLSNAGRVIDIHEFSPESDGGAGAGDGKILAPMPGKIVRVIVTAGDEVTVDQPLLVMESMKVEMTIKAPCDGIIEDVNIADGEQVADGAVLIAFAQQEAA